MVHVRPGSAEPCSRSADAFASTHASSWFGPRALLQALDLVAGIDVDDEGWKETPDVRPDGLRGTYVEALGLRLLGEHGDVMAA